MRKVGRPTPIWPAPMSPGAVTLRRRGRRQGRPWPVRILAGRDRDRCCTTRTTGNTTFSFRRLLPVRGRYCRRRARALGRPAGGVPQRSFQARSPKIRTLEDEIGRVVRARVVNPKWIAGVMRHGYKGAFEMAATVDYMFAFAATAHAVADHHFDLVFEAYLEDGEVRKFLEDNTRRRRARLPSGLSRPWNGACGSRASNSVPWAPRRHRRHTDEGSAMTEPDQDDVNRRANEKAKKRKQATRQDAGHQDHRKGPADRPHR